MARKTDRILDLDAGRAHEDTLAVETTPRSRDALVYLIGQQRGHRAVYLDEIVRDAIISEARRRGWSHPEDPSP